MNLGPQNMELDGGLDIVCDSGAQSLMDEVLLSTWSEPLHPPADDATSVSLDHQDTADPLNTSTFLINQTLTERNRETTEVINECFQRLPPSAVSQ